MLLYNILNSFIGKVVKKFSDLTYIQAGFEFIFTKIKNLQKNWVRTTYFLHCNLCFS